MQASLDLETSSILSWNRIHPFQARYNIEMEFGPYLLKTAQTQTELLQTFKLRHDVFFKEFQGKVSDGLDIDRFDFHFDHLLIIFKETKQIVGTYRLMLNPSLNESYTALEFRLEKLLKQKGPHLELGRACIAKDHRRGAVMALLWKGIAEYMKITGAQTVFGCSSVKVTKAYEAALLYKSLIEDGKVLKPLLSAPTNLYTFKGIDYWLAKLPKTLNEDHRSRADNILPSLLRSYLKLGAKIASLPAFDTDFNCMDILTILKREELIEAASKRYSLA